MTATGTLTSVEPDTGGPRELLPGYRLDEDGTGAWCSLPWPADKNGLRGLVEWSIGATVINWCETWLVHHLTGAPWRFTPRQRRFIVQWYRVRVGRDGLPRWVWRSGCYRRSKGAGKDPMMAALINAEAYGPVIPVIDDGKMLPPEAHRMALVQIAANSEEQGKDLLRVVNGQQSEDLADEHGIDAGLIKTKAASGTLIEVLTNSERSAEGDPSTFAVLNESHWMTETSGGQALAGVVRRNIGKSPRGMARILEATNAHEGGGLSVAEETYEAWQTQVQGLTPRHDILYDSREAPPHLRMTVEEELEAGIHAAYAESPWIDEERIRDEAQDPRVPVSDSIRFYFNALPTNETAWIEPRKLDQLARPAEFVAEKEPVTLFLDCSKSEDATALMGCRMSDGHVFFVGCWHRPAGWQQRVQGLWRVPREHVDAEVRAVFARYRVSWFGVDESSAIDDLGVSYWADLVDEWHRSYSAQLGVWADGRRHSTRFDMRLSSQGGADRNRLMTVEAEATASAIDQWEQGSGRPSFTWDGHPLVRTHFFHARRRPNQWGIMIGKKTRDSSQKIDLALAAVGARLGRRLVLNSSNAPRNPVRVRRVR